MIDLPPVASHSPDMSIEASMKCTPRAFDPELGEAARQAVPGLSKPLGDLIAGTAGSSPYLHGLIMSQAGWLPEALADPEPSLTGAPWRNRAKRVSL